MMVKRKQLKVSNFSTSFVLKQLSFTSCMQGNPVAELNTRCLQYILSRPQLRETSAGLGAILTIGQCSHLRFQALHTLCTDESVPKP